MKEGLSPGKEFWESEKTIKVLAESEYFTTTESSDVNWPDTIKRMLSDSKCVDLSWLRSLRKLGNAKNISTV